MLLNAYQFGASYPHHHLEENSVDELILSVID